MGDRNAVFVSKQQVREIRRLAKQVDSMDLFNLITGPDLLDTLDTLLSEYREHRFPPTVMLAVILGQVPRADRSCQNAVNEAIVNQLLQGAAAVSAYTGGYGQARGRWGTARCNSRPARRRRRRNSFASRSDLPISRISSITHHDGQRNSTQVASHLCKSQ